MLVMAILAILLGFIIPLSEAFFVKFCVPRWLSIGIIAVPTILWFIYWGILIPLKKIALRKKHGGFVD